MKKLTLIALIGIMAAALGAQAAQAYYVEYIDSRSSTNPAQIVGDGAYGNGQSGKKHYNGFKIFWDITQDSATSPFHYVYTLSGSNGGSLSSTLSHWILQVSIGAARGDFFNFTPPYTTTYGMGTYSPGGSNPGIPGSIYGIKWGSGHDYPLDGYPLANQVYTFSFDSWRVPVWGDFYAKDGQGYAYNTGYGSTPGSDTTGFIMVPDTQMVQNPIPTSVLLLGTGLAGLVGMRWRFRKK